MTLPANIAATYPDLSPGDTAHQQHHDTVHADINAVRAAYDAAVVGGFVGTFAAWVLTLDDVAAGGSTAGALTFVTGLAVDGTGNQATAINAAINALPVVGANFDPRGGGTVRLPHGIIRITSSIILKNNVILEGTGSGTILLVDANIEGITATATDAFGQSGWVVRDLKMMTTSTTTTAVGIATHAFGVASGGFHHCTIERVQIAKTSGATPVYGKFLKGISLDFFIESAVRDVNINTGLIANGIGIELLNASNASPLDDVVVRECVTGILIDGNSLVPIYGSTIEGCSVYGIRIINGVIMATGTHLESSAPCIDLSVLGGQSGSFIGGEMIKCDLGVAQPANKVNDWLFAGVLVRNSMNVGTGCLNTTFVNGGGTLTNNGVDTSYINCRFNAATRSTSSLPNLAQVPLVRNLQTVAAYTLVASDIGKIVERNWSTANTLTVPPNSAVPFSDGTVIKVRQLAAGQVTFTPGTGVTILSLGGALRTAGQYAEATLTRRATDEWVLSDDIVV